ncbi:phospholipid transfer protein C2CD2L isoform X2 [Engraulis encrasicolus]|uniref:phospholipid transfer protein C2CD2L isoform X2 n=1 Tax=Engraulis encrasicolus TaxID=184585 RepID=UPI002FD37AA8
MLAEEPDLPPQTDPIQDAGSLVVGEEGAAGPLVLDVAATEEVASLVVDAVAEEAASLVVDVADEAASLVVDVADEAASLVVDVVADEAAALVVDVAEDAASVVVEVAEETTSLAADEKIPFLSPGWLEEQDWEWMLLVGLFVASVLVVLTWLVQFCRNLRYPKRTRTHSKLETPWQLHLPLNLTHQTLTGGVWGSLLRLKFGRAGGGSGDTEAGVKGLISSLFSFKSFREHWQRAWVRALNEQASRQGSSIQINFSESLQLPSSASIDHVTCTDQSSRSMVLQCTCSVDTVSFPVSVTQQSHAAVSMDTYQVTIEPTDAQLVVSLEEVEEEGLLVSWTFSQQPQLYVTVSSMKIQRKGSDPEVDLSVIRDLVEDTLYSTQPAMILNLRACVSSPAFPREKLLNRPSSLSPGQAVTQKLLVCQLRAAMVRKESRSLGELCCALSLDVPTVERRTHFLSSSSSGEAKLEWNEDVILDMYPDTKELQIRLLERNSRGEHFLGQTSLLLNVSNKRLSGQQHLSISPGQGLSTTAWLTFELQYLDPSDPRFGQSSTPIRSSLTPTKKVDVDRTIMPDGTIVTTVTTIQTRPKLDRKLGDSPSRSPSKVEVTEKRPTVLIDAPGGASVSSTPSTESSLSNGLDPVAETAIRQLTESSGKVSKKTPTKRSTLIISGVSKVPVTEDDSALSAGYAASMDAALQGDVSPGSALNHCGGISPHPDVDETTPSDVSERPSVDDVDSETGSTGALETRSLKDHKSGLGFLRSGTKFLLRRKNRQKDPTFSQSHEDMSNVGDDTASSASTSVRKKSGSFSRRLIKRFSFRSSKSKGKASATNGGTSVADK